MEADKEWESEVDGETDDERESEGEEEMEDDIELEIEEGMCYGRPPPFLYGGMMCAGLPGFSFPFSIS